MASIEVHDLTKRYGDTIALDGVSFTATAGRVTGFLGKNGAGKTTTMRILLGLAEPTAGTATFDGTAYAELAEPIRQVGAVITNDAFHPSRTARQHLQIMATAAGIDRRRIDAVLEEAGIADVARRQVGGYSLGMRQRLALAGALLGDPAVLILDEPLNGLDPDGIDWIRALVRRMAAEGRTVLLSSHLLTEVAATVDDVVVLSGGRVVAARPLAELATSRSITVQTLDAPALAAALAAEGITANSDNGVVEIHGGTAEQVGRTAARIGAVVTAMNEHHDDLGHIFHELTQSQEATS